jgi:glutathione reductase (NADPH)
MSAEHYDVLIVGGGNAGMGVTVPTRAADLSVAMVDPKKFLWAAGHAIDEIHRARAHSICVGESHLNWAALIDREKQMISHIPGALARTMADRGVNVIRARTAFWRGSTSSLRQAPAADAAGSRGGAYDRVRRDTNSVWSLKSRLADVLSEREQPREVVFVGGGVIALELGQCMLAPAQRSPFLRLSLLFFRPATPML